MPKLSTLTSAMKGLAALDAAHAAFADVDSETLAGVAAEARREARVVLAAEGIVRLNTAHVTESLTEAWTSERSSTPTLSLTAS